MWILSNVEQLYDGTSADTEAVQRGVDVHVDPGSGRIHLVRPHEPDLEPGEGRQRIDATLALAYADSTALHCPVYNLTAFSPTAGEFADLVIASQHQRSGIEAVFGDPVGMLADCRQRTDHDSL